MTIQYSTAVNNARLDAIETIVGASAKLKVYTGTKPANCATSATGTLLVDMDLPSDWMSAASANSKAKSGTWTGVGAASGVAGYFRITNTDGTAVGIQGSAGTSGADMIFDNTNIAVEQAVTVTSFTISAPV
jgi:hypothetical protein